MYVQVTSNYIALYIATNEFKSVATYTYVVVKITILYYFTSSDWSINIIMKVIFCVKILTVYILQNKSLYGTATYIL